MSKNNPPPSDPTPMELAQNPGDNPSVSCTTKIQPCDCELAFGTTNHVVVNTGGFPWKFGGNFFTKTL
jgi:hypothetical protein